MKQILTAIFICLFSTAVAFSAEKSELVLLEANRIWDKAPHNAFTDLLRFKGKWYCVFREGSAHVSPDGSLRVITSTDGKKWESIALITSPKYDLLPKAPIPISRLKKRLMKGRDKL